MRTSGPWGTADEVPGLQPTPAASPSPRDRPPADAYPKERRVETPLLPLLVRGGVHDHRPGGSDRRPAAFYATRGITALPRFGRAVMMWVQFAAEMLMYLNALPDPPDPAELAFR